MAKSFKHPVQRLDIYQEVTDKIVAMLEKGVRPWARSWGGPDDDDTGPALRPLRHNGEAYRGINVLILWASAIECGFSSPYWMTYNQASALGGQVKNGSKSTKIVFFKALTVEQDTDNERQIPLIRSFSVFNADQIENLPAKYNLPEAVAPVASPDGKNVRIPYVDAFVDALGVSLKHGGNKAFYVISQDRVQMPNFDSFDTGESYYCTLFHEDIHWTRHPTRLDRDFKERKGYEGYAAEELVAELGAAYLAADLGLSSEPREDHASYLANWLQALKNDKKAIFVAASFAEKAVRYLHGIADPTTTVEAENEDEMAVAA